MADPTRTRDAPHRSRRRRFLAAVVRSPLAVGFWTLAATNLLWLLGCFRFMLPNVLLEPPMRFRAGSPQDLAFGQVETRYTAQHGAVDRAL